LLVAWLPGGVGDARDGLELVEAMVEAWADDAAGPFLSGLVM
jgi:hypothetical protein